ncbi:MAG: Crp/Fnr family transcriptional regulator [Acidimicrobiia bacterium]|nr:Crp/Fnr family transcriptional regulator [Acidimicrobiia bacterium]
MFWDLLSDDDKEAIRGAGVKTTYPAGNMLFHYGDEPTHVLVLLNGLVKLTLTSVDGREVMIELRGAGNMLGELGPIDSLPRSTSVMVIEDVEAIVVPTSAFRQLLLDRGTLSYAVLTLVAEKLRQSTQRRLEAGVGDAHARLCGRLVELAESAEMGSDGVIEVNSPLTQQELADWIGVSRDAIVLALRRIRELGWIETGRRTIRIHDLEALRRAAVE